MPAACVFVASARCGCRRRPPPTRGRCPTLGAGRCDAELDAARLDRDATGSSTREGRAQRRLARPPAPPCRRSSHARLRAGRPSTSFDAARRRRRRARRRARSTSTAVVAATALPAHAIPTRRRPRRHTIARAPRASTTGPYGRAARDERCFASSTRRRPRGAGASSGCAAAWRRSRTSSAWPSTAARLRARRRAARHARGGRRPSCCSSSPTRTPAEPALSSIRHDRGGARSGRIRAALAAGRATPTPALSRPRGSADRTVSRRSSPAVATARRPPRWSLPAYGAPGAGGRRAVACRRRRGASASARCPAAGARPRRSSAPSGCRDR